MSFSATAPPNSGVKISIDTNPNASSAGIVLNTKRDSSESFRHRRRRIRSKITVKPRPPTKNSAMKIVRVVESSSSRARLWPPDSMSNPALVNAEME